MDDAVESQKRRHHRVMVAELLDGGLLQVGDRLHKSFRGRMYEVTVRADGRLDSTDGTFDTPSQAARLLTGQKAVNGWKFWLTEGGEPLEAIRSQLPR